MSEVSPDSVWETCYAAPNRADEGGRRPGRPEERRHTAAVGCSCDLLDQFLLQTQACLGCGEAEQTGLGWRIKSDAKQDDGRRLCVLLRSRVYKYVSCLYMCRERSSAECAFTSGIY